MKASNALAAGLASALETGWQVTARSNQLPPDGDWSIWLLLAGRGFGKTRVLSEMANARASSGQTKRIAIVAATAADTRDVMVEGESGILATAPPWCVPVYQSTRRRLEWPNGALAYCYSAEAGSAAWPAARRRALRRARLVAGPECVGHVDVRAATRKAPQDSHREYAAADQVDPPVAVARGQRRPRCNPRPTFENRDNLAPAFFSQIVNRYEGTRLGRQELLAEVLMDIPGALWSLDTIDKGRRD